MAGRTEQGIAGFGIGLAAMGQTAVAEIQFAGISLFSCGSDPNIYGFAWLRRLHRERGRSESAAAKELTPSRFLATVPSL